MILATALLLASTLTTEPPHVQTIVVPGGQVPTEIRQHAGALWFVSWRNWPKLEPYIGKITVRGTIYLNEVQAGFMPGLMTRRRDGSLWLSDRKFGVLWTVSPRGEIRRVKAERPTVGIAAGPDGFLWCTHPGSPVITSYDLEGNVRSRWNVATRKRQTGVEKRSRSGPTPQWIVTGPDEALWFNEPVTAAIGRIGTDGAIRMFRLPKGWKSPGEIVRGSEDSLWFIVGNQPMLGRITTAGKITAVKIHARAVTLAADQEGRIWYSDYAGGAGYVDASGVADHFSIEGKPGLIRSMAVGPDGAMWFVDEKNKVLGRMAIREPKAP